MSRVIKAQWVDIENDETRSRTISIKPLATFHAVPAAEEAEVNVKEAVDVEPIYQKANEEAALIISQARNQAEEIRLQLQQERLHWEDVERKRLEEDARKIGYDDGLAMGKQKGIETAHDHIAKAQEILRLAKEDSLTYLAAAERTILDLAMQTARKIIKKEIEADNEYFVQVVKTAIKDARESREVQLRIHPDCYELLVSQKNELQSIFPNETNFYIIPDDELGEGGCIIESSAGRIDASVDSQLSEIKRKLTEILEGE